MPHKVITLAELREHTTKDNLWVLLHGNGQSTRICNSSCLLMFSTVYDVTKFIDEVHRITCFSFYGSYATFSTLEAMK